MGAKANLHFNPKVEFPTFDGMDPKGWVKKCTRYFSLCRIGDEQKVDLAVLHFIGPAEIWFNSYILGRRHITWEEFIVDVCSRFRDDLGSKVVEDFNRLQQGGTLDEYLVRFEELKALLLVRNPMMPASYFLESFVGGLKPAIKSFVRALNPQNLDAAMEIARLQEQTISALKMPIDRSTKPHSMHLNPKPLLPTPNPANKANFTSGVPPRGLMGNTSGQRPIKFIPAAVRAEKIAKGLCYYCD